jgi:hypothetical protein
LIRRQITSWNRSELQTQHSNIYDEKKYEDYGQLGGRKRIGKNNFGEVVSKWNNTDKFLIHNLLWRGNDSDEWDLLNNIKIENLPQRLTIYKIAF